MRGSLAAKPTRLATTTAPADQMTRDRSSDRWSTSGMTAPSALGFFALGVGVALVVLPFAAQFLLSFATEDVVPLLSAREYFDFVSTLFLAFGILMEFPVLLVGLSRVGIVTSERLRKSRRYVLLGIAVFSAIATPGGDLVSPTVLGFTLYLLFEATVIVIRRSGR